MCSPSSSRLNCCQSQQPVAQDAVAQGTAQPQIRMVTPKALQQLQGRQQVGCEVEGLAAAALRLGQFAALTVLQRPPIQLRRSMGAIRRFHFR